MQCLFVYASPGPTRRNPPFPPHFETGHLEQARDALGQFAVLLTLAQKNAGHFFPRHASDGRFIIDATLRFMVKGRF